MKKGLIVFAREPVPGLVKTRLATKLGNQAAADLYETMLQDVLNGCRKLDDIDTVVFWECGAERLPHLEEKYRCSSRRQTPGNLGQRMQAAFEQMLAEGCDICCIIGSDAPDLPLTYITEAYRLLEEERTGVVFGPASDGGYYLLGLSRMVPQLFSNIPWSSATVLEASLAAARRSGSTTILLPEWQDIDTVEDLSAFHERKRLSESGGPT
jgi:rSAM/selenodomain-associated transferase 1